MYPTHKKASIKESIAGRMAIRREEKNRFYYRERSTRANYFTYREELTKTKRVYK